ncbi:unnamed protein product [Musa acuminata subsp. malaccensis]|uniref:(wild Malaysian banana) hypothetical protein n=1 Tax=Musa acuminata subsp. malaccensis TaxID=214687 RepID=A0A804HTU9_MUSAM|nr:unnamed protein product [Musa acuminata subsp. malaccensis]
MPPKAISKIEMLLNFIFDEVGEGEIFTVLGMNGSSKPTLIDALATRIVWESLSGPIILNDKKLESWLLELIFTYDIHDNLLYPMLTVEETFMFSVEFWLS